MSQKEQIKKHLKSGKRITTWTAMTMFACARLSERIRELEAEGLRIKRQWLHKDGKRVVAYSL